MNRLADILDELHENRQEVRVIQNELRRRTGTDRGLMELLSERRSEATSLRLELQTWLANEGAMIRTPMTDAILATIREDVKSGQRLLVTDALMSFLADLQHHRQTLLLCLDEDPWGDVVKALARATDKVVLVAPDAPAWNAVNVVPDLCKRSRDDYGSLKSWLQEAATDLSLVVGLSILSAAPVAGSWFDVDPCEATCLSLVFPLRFPRGWRNDIAMVESGGEALRRRVESLLWPTVALDLVYYREALNVIGDA